MKAQSGWIDAEDDPAAEGYFAVLGEATAKLRFAGFYPEWSRGDKAELVTVEAGGVSLKTISGKTSNALWQAGSLCRFTPRQAVQKDDGVHIEFDPSPVGKLEALWQLRPGESSTSVSLTFVPAAEGQVTLGYELFFRRDLAKVAEVLLPMMWHRHRLPTHPTTLLDNCTPTPIALAEPVHEPDQPARCFALIGEPADIPFAWPDGRQTHFGLSLADEAGNVQPSIWGPVLGTGAAAVHAGKTVQFRFRVLVQPGDWYAGYRTAADQIDGLRDYRSNVRVSLTEAALNMIDLLMDDSHGGWWARAKAFDQIESKNGSTQCSPMTMLSLYRLTGSEELYRRRALPTLDFMLSREGPHFSPVPDDTGTYPAGSMNGPVKLFGTGTYGGLWELTGRRTDAFGQIALPENNIRPTGTTAHCQLFDEWLARYQLTHEKADLDHACELADQYIQTQILTPPAKDLGPTPFFYISFVPDWEGLLRLYEATGRKSYLDAAAFGARQLMTGVWTQPLIPAGQVTIHPGGKFVGDATHMWWKGPQQYRLGWPPAPDAIQEKSVPAWEVSNVGLGFEQPSTFNARAAGRQIYEEAWAPHFLRLYRYTGDRSFLTCARNAIVGRWGNYPGYYATGQTDLPQNPRYPLTGPDVTDIYYHHIPAHLAWTIDYLVSEAEALSDGRINFPALDQHGYAYFDSRIFGHAPGRVFDDAEAWLVLRRGLLSLDNVQINYLTAQSSRAFHVMMTNQSQQEQRVTVNLLPEALAKVTQGWLRIGKDEPVELAIDHGHATVTIPARGLAVLSISGISADVRSDIAASDTKMPRPDSMVILPHGAIETRAAPIQVNPGSWDAYVWSTASPAQAKSATLHYTLGGEAHVMECQEYPFEFSIPIGDEKSELRFHLDITRPDGSTTHGPEGRLSLGLATPTRLPSP
jgi:hypothetical protein